MPGVRHICGLMAVGLAAVGSALPAQPRLSPRGLKIYGLAERQATATGLPTGLTDVDILQLYVEGQEASSNGC